MCKFTYSENTNCLILKDSEGKLIDYKFYNNIQIQGMSVKNWLQMIHDDIKAMATANKLEDYIYNLLEA